MSRSRIAEPSVTLGRSVDIGAVCRVVLSALRTTGAHIIGAAGYGKSFLLRLITQALIALRQPFGLIDPHGDLAESTVWQLRLAGVRPENIVIIDPSEPRWATAFNPLCSGLGDAGEITSFTMDAFAKAFGNASFDTAPRMEGLLRAVIRTLVDSRLSLLEGWDFLSVDNVSLRRALRQNVTDDLVRQDLAEYEKLGRAEKIHVAESTRNRLRRLIQAAPVQMMLAQTERTLDLHDVLENGKYLIVNLAGVPPEIQRLIGALLANAILHAAKQRDPRRRRHWFLIADEFGEFATRDFANALDTLRKFGVSLIAAHQRLDQLMREDPDVLSAVMTNMKIKIAFGGLSRRDADVMARELFTGAVNGERIKHKLSQTKFRPVEDEYVVETESESESDSWASSFSSSRGLSSGVSEGISENHWQYPGDPFYDDSEDPFLRTSSSSRQSSVNEGAGEGRAIGSSRSKSRSFSTIPITRHEEFSEVSSITYHGVDEEWERHVALLHGLPKREALIRVFNGPVLHIRTADVPQEVLDDRWYRYKRLIMERSPYAQPVEVVQRQIEARRMELAALAMASDEKERPFDVGSFRQ